MMYKTYLTIGQVREGEWGMALNKEALFGDGDAANPYDIIALADQLRRLSAAWDEMEKQVRGEEVDDGEKADTSKD